jgi:hypothetical protein
MLLYLKDERYCSIERSRHHSVLEIEEEIIYAAIFEG